MVLFYLCNIFHLRLFLRNRKIVQVQQAFQAVKLPPLVFLQARLRLYQEGIEPLLFVPVLNMRHAAVHAMGSVKPKFNPDIHGKHHIFPVFHRDGNFYGPIVPGIQYLTEKHFGMLAVPLPLFSLLPYPNIHFISDSYHVRTH